MIINPAATNKSATNYTETDPTVPAWAKEATKPAYTASEVGALAETGTAVAAAKLATARTIRTNLASTAAASFDGSANVTPGVTGILPLANGGTGVNSLAALKTLLGTAQIEVGTYVGDASINITTPQAVPVAFTPKFVWVGALGIDAAPWYHYSDYDDTQSPPNIDDTRFYSAYAFTGFPWGASDDDEAVEALEITTAGFNVCNALLTSTSSSTHQTIYTRLNLIKYTYFYLAVG